MQGSAITKICPDKMTSSLLLQQPLHILKLPPTCQCYIKTLPPTPTLWGWLGNHACILLIMQISIQSTSQPQTFAFGNILMATGLQFTFRNWQMYLRSPSHSSASTWLARVNLSYHLRSAEIWKKDPLLHGSSEHRGTYIGTISMIFFVCIGVYCLKRFWFRPATLRYQPYSPVSSWHTIVDDNVEVAPGLQRQRHGWKTCTTPYKSWNVHGMGGYIWGRIVVSSQFCQSCSSSQIIGH